MNKYLFLLALILLLVNSLAGQEKRGYQWIIGYDSSSLDSIGEAILLNFNEKPVSISKITSVDNFHMEGSNTSICDKEGNLLFYSNGCLVVNAAGEVMENGDTINPGFLQDYFCPYGGSPIRQGAVAVPSPEHESLYYLFNLDMDTPYEVIKDDSTGVIDTFGFSAIAPQRLYYQLIDMSLNDGLGAVVAKNQIAVQDTFARGNIQAVRHANGRDWWIVVPKSHSNCYFLVLITPDGIQPPQLRCSGHIWSDDDSGAQAVFSPDLEKYIRFNAWNGLNIFNFDNSTGDLSNPVQILFPNDTINYIAGVAVSPNSRFLYVCARKRVYQFDLTADHIESSKIQVAEWDGTYNPYATIFYLAALAPDGKIYISSTSSTFNLHVIENPDSMGLACNLIQHGVTLPSYNFATIPNIPHYCRSEEECEVLINSTYKAVEEPLIIIYPNPAKDKIWIDFPDLGSKSYSLDIYDLTGRHILNTKITSPLSPVDISMLPSGAFFYFIKGMQTTSTGKIVITH